MKKSQLRNIIRESIKELNEVAGPAPGAYVVLNTCDCDPTTGAGCANPNTQSGAYGIAYSSSTVCMTVDNGQMPQVGQLLNIPNMVPYLYGSPAPVVEHVHPNHPACQPGGSGYPPYDWPTLGWCDGWECKPKGNHPKFGHECVQVAGGEFATKQDCMSVSPCMDWLPADDGIDMGDGPSLEMPPLTTDPQDMTKPEDEFGTLDIKPDEEELFTRMQELANIKK